jgi:hypothetical protein
MISVSVSIRIQHSNATDTIRFAIEKVFLTILTRLSL